MISQKFLTLLGVASIVTLVAVLSLSTYLVSEQTRVSTEAMSVTSCGCTEWEQGECYGWECTGNHEKHQYRLCYPEGCANTNQCVIDDNCPPVTPTPTSISPTPTPSPATTPTLTPTSTPTPQAVGPDLIIKSMWLTYGKFGYAIKNQGDANAIASTTQLLVDDVEEDTDSVGELNPADEQNHMFENYLWSCSGQSDVVRICADINNGVEESEETNNCYQEEWYCPTPTPTLTPTLTPTHKACSKMCRCTFSGNCECSYECKVVVGEGQDECIAVNECFPLTPTLTPTPSPTGTPEPSLTPIFTPTPTPEHTSYISGNVSINNPDNVSLLNVRVRGHHIYNGSFEPITPVEVSTTGGSYEITGLVPEDQYLLRAEAFRSPDDVLVGYTNWESPTAPAVGVNFALEIKGGLLIPPLEGADITSVDGFPDGVVDGADAAVVMSQWGSSGSGLEGDLNNDGEVNALDASILVSNWGLSNSFLNWPRASSRSY